MQSRFYVYNVNGVTNWYQEYSVGNRREIHSVVICRGGFIRNCCKSTWQFHRTDCSDKVLQEKVLVRWWCASGAAAWDQTHAAVQEQSLVSADRCGARYKHTLFVSRDETLCDVCLTLLVTRWYSHSCASNVIRVLCAFGSKKLKWKQCSAALALE